MQNKYVGDIGDFANNGLLRWLCYRGRGPLLEPILRLGVVWYRNDLAENQNNDGGNRRDYLQNTPGNLLRFRQCDPDLYNAMQWLNGNRRISAIRQSAILPCAFHFEQGLNFADNDEQPRRNEGRQRWLEDALEETKESRIVFINPDKSIASKEKEREALISDEHAYIRELRPFVERGNSLVIYHHAAFVSHEMQYLYLVMRLQSELGLTKVSTLKFSAGGGGSRFYFIVVQPRDRDIINERLVSFGQSLWCDNDRNLFTLCDEPHPSISMP